MEIEDKIVQLAKQGNQEALGQIVKKYERLVYNLGLRLLNNEEEAECILQETFLKVVQSIKSFKENSQLSTWIYRIATNQALMRLRARKKQHTTVDIENIEDFKDYTFLNNSFLKSPLEDLLNSELKDKMSGAIELLPEKYKSVFILKDIEGLSLNEISDMLDISVPAVKSNLHRARLFLREQLAEFFDGRKKN